MRETRTTPLLRLPLHRIGSTMILLGLLTFAPQAVAEAIQSLSALQQTASTFVIAQFDPDDSVEVRAGALDRRLRLAACSTALEAFLPSGSRSVGNTAVGVRCPGATPWTVYVPVTIHRFGEVVVLKRALARGTVVQPDDIKLVRRELSGLVGNYLGQAEDAVGMVTRRSIGAESVVTAAMLAPLDVVKRGQQVEILARAGTFTVRGSGTALADGSVGELVRVRNARSKRTIEAVVASPGVVEVRL